ncbi:MAG: hypothetical protein QM723_18655 [Myxococcaceae bacterium]
MSPPIKPTSGNVVRIPKSDSQPKPAAEKPAPKPAPHPDHFAGSLVLTWHRAQIAARGIDPDSGLDVRTVSKDVNAARAQKYEQDLERALAEQRKIDGK